MIMKHWGRNRKFCRLQVPRSGRSVRRVRSSSTRSVVALRRFDPCPPPVRAAWRFSMFTIVMRYITKLDAEQKDIRDRGRYPASIRLLGMGNNRIGPNPTGLGRIGPDRSWKCTGSDRIGVGNAPDRTDPVRSGAFPIRCISNSDPVRSDPVITHTASFDL